MEKRATWLTNHASLAMAKLHLKRTPAEEQERARRKAYKAAKRAAKQKRSDDLEPGSSSRKRKHSNPESGDDLSSHRPDDDDTLRVGLEEMRFRKKMWEALEDDERLDGISARFNGYPHIPDRWACDEHDLANPQYMDDDEYAEWVREGMWK